MTCPAHQPLALKQDPEARVHHEVTELDQVDRFLCHDLARFVGVVVVAQRAAVMVHPGVRAAVVDEPTLQNLIGLPALLGGKLR